MAKRPPVAAPLPGVFRPAPPRDSAGVLWTYAVAARIVTERPDLFAEVSDRLGRAMQGLQPPASLCAADCARLWRLFAKVAASPKVGLRLESGNALYRDLDALGQRLDLAPLPRWRELPLALVDDTPPKLEKLSSGSGGDTVDTVRARARGKKSPGALAPAEVLTLLQTLSAGEREVLLSTVVKAGVVVRTDAGLLAQLLHQGRGVGPDDEALQETLRLVGAYLAGP